jgi:hypothetical protein
MVYRTIGDGLKHLPLARFAMQKSWQAVYRVPKQ